MHPYPLRLPDDLYTALAAEATALHISVNAYLILLLQGDIVRPCVTMQPDADASTQ